MKPTRIDAVEPYDCTWILRESQSEGHGMVNRLLTEFRSGHNRFDAPGEALYASLLRQHHLCTALGSALMLL